MISFIGIGNTQGVEIFKGLCDLEDEELGLSLRQVLLLLDDFEDVWLERILPVSQ